MNLFDREEECSGCSACYNICPKRAINMELNKEGFQYPKINNNICIECSLCEKICDFKKKGISNSEFNQAIYAAKNSDDKIRNKSTSGGVFTLLAKKILNENGSVYGVRLNEDMEVIHDVVKDEKNLEKFRGSKYVQSKLDDIFKSIEHDLKEELKVLFTGTPCQIEGLKNYLEFKKVGTENLMLCDIVCHGVPSPLIFSDYVKFSEKKSKQKMIDYRFRDKKNGWHIHTEKAIYDSGKEDDKSMLVSIYKYLFYSHLILRPSCHKCKYTSFKRVSDITIADFWGVEKVFEDFDDNKGVSLVLVNTSKGKKIFSKIDKFLEIREVKQEQATQPQLEFPTIKNIRRDEFWNDYEKFGFEFIAKKYASYRVFYRVRRYIKNMIYDIFKKQKTGP